MSKLQNVHSAGVNILSLICINHETPEIMLQLTRTRGFFSIFTQHQRDRSLAHTVSPDKIHHGHHQSFWRLRNRSVQCVLDYHAFQLVIVWNFVTIHHLLQRLKLINLQNLDPDCLAASFQFSELGHMESQMSDRSEQCASAPSCWNRKLSFDKQRSTHIYIVLHIHKHT